MCNTRCTPLHCDRGRAQAPRCEHFLDNIHRYHHTWLRAASGQLLPSPQVMIVDFDVHHGNGTQDLFYDDTSVLSIDIHEQDVWPGSGQVGERGTGEGEGYTINVPLPGENMCSNGCQEWVAVYYAHALFL